MEGQRELGLALLVEHACAASQHGWEVETLFRVGSKGLLEPIKAGDEMFVGLDLALCRLANNNRVGGAVKAGARFLDATASQVG